MELAQLNSELQRLSLVYQIPVVASVEGHPQSTDPIAPDLLADFMTTPIFPETDQAPVDLQSPGPGDGLNLNAGATPIMNMTLSEVITAQHR